MLKSCLGCNKLFDDPIGDYKLCKECRAAEEELLRKVKDYLWDNPGTSEAKLEELFDVTRKQVTRWLREGRLEVTPESDIKLTCMRCGSNIKSGRFCGDCVKKLKDGFAKEIPNLKKKGVYIGNIERDERMRYL
ncbi:MAG: MerR family transcriptional regulator [Lachnospiraceae bacterium]|nr:MerR family transcriptional regulator [Lachnospiraceae bacterium]